jgi:hypothetical protein
MGTCARSATELSMTRSRNITPSRSATLGPTTTMFVEYGRLNEAQRVRWLVPLGWLSGDDVPVKQE